MTAKSGGTTALFVPRRAALLFARDAKEGGLDVAMTKEKLDPPQSVVSFGEKNYRPSAVEQDLYDWWERSGFFTPDENNPNKPFVMMLPLPNVTGDLHLGHALGFGGYEDLMARWHRMLGEPTLYMAGTDHAGIIAAEGGGGRDREEGTRRAPTSAARSSWTRCGSGWTTTGRASRSSSVSSDARWTGHAGTSRWSRPSSARCARTSSGCTSAVTCIAPIASCTGACAARRRTRTSSRSTSSAPTPLYYVRYPWADPKRRRPAAHHRDHAA